MNIEGFAIERDLTASLITVHVGSGEYKFQALWE